MFSSGASLLLAALVSAGPGLPLGMPPAKENPVMAKVAPDECIAYFSWAGSAVPNPESTNHAEKLLAEPEVQQFATDLEKFITDLFLKEAARSGPEAEKMAKLATDWGRKLLARPGAAFLSKLAVGGRGFDVDAGLVVDLGEDAVKFKATATAELVKMLIAFDVPVDLSEADGFTMAKIQLGDGAPPITFGVKDSLLIVAVGPDAAKGILQRLKTDPPAWLTDLRKQLPVERPSLVTYADAQKIIELGKFFILRGEPDDGLLNLLQATGLHNLKSVSAVTGFDERSLVTRVRVRFDGKPIGLLSAANAKPLMSKDLSSIPQDATFAIATRMDVGTTLDSVLTELAKQQPDLPLQVSKQLEAMAGRLGFHPRKDLIDALGDVWRLYHSAGEGGYLLGFAGVVKVRDRDKLAAIQKHLLDRAQAADEELKKFGHEMRIRYQPKLNKLSWNGSEIFSISGLGQMPLAPSWCLTNDELIVAPFPQIIKAYLSRGDDFQSLASLPRVTELLEGKDKPVTLVYQDTPRLFRLAYPLSQFAVRMLSAELARDDIDIDVSLVPSGSAIAKHLTADSISVSPTDDGFEVTVHESLPGSARVVPLTVAAGSFFWVMESRDARDLAEAISMIVSPDAANEAIAKNNLKQILLALHNYHDTYGRLPAAFTTNKEGKPLLSWRVQILPFLEQGHLYERFKLDEPWDSDHNKKLIPLMPETYASPGNKAKPSQTSFLTIRQADALFPGAKGIRFAEVTDGLSNTIAVVEASEKAAVTWTKPDDFKIDEMTRIAALNGLRQGGFLAGIADGSVQKVKAGIDEKNFRLLWHRHDGMPIDFDAFILDRNRRGRLLRGRDRVYDEAAPTEIDLPRGEVEKPLPDARKDAIELPKEPIRGDAPKDAIEEGAKP